MPATFRIIDRLIDLADLDVGSLIAGQPIGWDSDTNTFIGMTGAGSPLTLTAHNSTETPLTITLAASQAVDAFDIYDSSTDLLVGVNSSGIVSIANRLLIGNVEDDDVTPVQIYGDLTLQTTADEDKPFLNLYNDGAGGKRYSVGVTNNDSCEGGGIFSIFNATDYNWPMLLTSDGYVTFEGGGTFQAQVLVNTYIDEVTLTLKAAEEQASAFLVLLNYSNENVVNIDINGAYIVWDNNGTAFLGKTDSREELVFGDEGTILCTESGDIITIDTNVNPAFAYEEEGFAVALSGEDLAASYAPLDGFEIVSSNNNAYTDGYGVLHLNTVVLHGSRASIYGISSGLYMQWTPSYVGISDETGLLMYVNDGGVFSNSNIHAEGSVWANSYYGDGSNLTGISATASGYAGDLQFNNGSNGFSGYGPNWSGSLLHVNGNVALNAGEDVRFNGSGDANWRIGILNVFSTAIIGRSTNLGVVVGTGSGGPDGFAVGQCENGNSILELRGYDGLAYFRNRVMINNPGDDGTSALLVNGALRVTTIYETDDLWAYGTDGLFFADSKQISWSNGDTWNDSWDLTIGRNSVNTLEIGNGADGVGNLLVGSVFASGLFISPALIGSVQAGFIGDYEDGSSPTLDFGLNPSQFGDRNQDIIGSIFRLDSRADFPYFSLRFQPIGGNTEYTSLQITNAGYVLIGNGWGADNNTGTGDDEDLQIYGNISVGGAAKLTQITSGYSAIDVFCGFFMHGHNLVMNNDGGTGGGNLIMDEGDIVNSGDISTATGKTVSATNFAGDIGNLIKTQSPWILDDPSEEASPIYYPYAVGVGVMPSGKTLDVASSSDATVRISRNAGSNLNSIEFNTTIAQSSWANMTLDDWENVTLFNWGYLPLNDEIEDWGDTSLVDWESTDLNNWQNLQLNPSSWNIGLLPYSSDFSIWLDDQNGDLNPVVTIDTSGNITCVGNGIYDGNVTATQFIGDGSQLTNISAGGWTVVGGEPQYLYTTNFVNIGTASSYNTTAPLNVTNISGEEIVPQANLINSGGGAGTGCAIDFYTYVNSTPDGRLAFVDDGNYSGNFVLYSKLAGSPTYSLVETLLIAASGDITTYGNIELGTHQIITSDWEISETEGEHLTFYNSDSGTTVYFDNAGGIVLSGGKIVGVSQIAQSVQALSDGGDSGTITWNLADGALATLTLAGTGETLSLTNSIAGTTCILVITQGSGGNFTITEWENVAFAGGVAPTLSTAEGAVDVLTLVCISSGSFYGILQNNFS